MQANASDLDAPPEHLSRRGIDTGTLVEPHRDLRRRYPVMGHRYGRHALRALPERRRARVDAGRLRQRSFRQRTFR